MSEFVKFTPGEYYDWEQPYVQDRLDIAAGRKQPEMPKLPAGMNLFAGPKPFTEAEILEYNRKWNPYEGLPQILCKPLTHSKIGTYSARWHRLNPMPPCLQHSARQDGCQGRRFHRRSLKHSA